MEKSKALSEAFGKVLRRLREERGLTQEEVSEGAELQRKYISMLELAENEPKLTTIFQLAKALNCRPSKLIELVEEELQKPIRKRPVTSAPRR